MPLTLALSPQAGRGDLPDRTFGTEENGAAYPFSSLAGRRWRQPDEGQQTAHTEKNMRERTA
nr:hypothetical protein SHINE37_42274 [Rhizobiaceae bacterium]